MFNRRLHASCDGHAHGVLAVRHDHDPSDEDPSRRLPGVRQRGKTQVHAHAQSGGCAAAGSSWRACGQGHWNSVSIYAQCQKALRRCRDDRQVRASVRGDRPHGDHLCHCGGHRHVCRGSTSR